MNICNYNGNCPHIDNCDSKVKITTYEDVLKGIERFTKGFGECDMSKSETQAYVQKLQNENNSLKCENEMLIAKYKEYESRHRDRLDELENQHQSDCIKINQLHTALDVMAEKYQRLRELKGL